MISQIAGLLAESTWSRLGDDAKEKLKLCLLANLSVAVAGVPYVKIPKPAVDGGAHFLFSGGRTSRARDAAFYNAAVMHARTQDDFHPLGNLHIATVVMPAALAAGEALPAKGELFLDALVAGYAAAVGVSRSLSARTTPKGLRSTCLYAPFGATAAVWRMKGLDIADLRSALALTASIAGGTTQCWIDGSDEWQLHVSAAAEHALLAVDLAHSGLRGGEHALDGKAGFFRAYADSEVSFEAIAPDFDPDRAINETVIKRYPVSGICQPVVRLSEKVADKHRVDAAAIKQVTINMTPFELNYSGTRNQGPFQSFSDVLMSASFCCASVLVNGRFNFADLHLLNRPDRDRLIAGTVLREDPALPTLSCRIELELADGRTISEEILHGGAALAIDWSTVDDWAFDLWREGGRTEADYRKFRDSVRGLETSSVAALIDTIVPRKVQ